MALHPQCPAPAFCDPGARARQEEADRLEAERARAEEEKLAADAALQEKRRETVQNQISEHAKKTATVLKVTQQAKKKHLNKKNTTITTKLTNVL